ncbi:unnamed protein product [Rhizopus stolonifer]
MNSHETSQLGDFKVLSKYDDLFSDIFLDNLFLWFNTIKMNKEHRKPRVRNTKILDIIRRHILERSKLTDAVNELLELDYFKQYLSLKNPKQVQEFVQHMRRYLNMYMPNAGYEIGDTKRYSERKLEACLVATKDWHTGDEMKLLTGLIATLDPQDDAELKRGNRDFSVMWSFRKNCACLFLGPARFANHDCESNCRFIAHGSNSITFKVTKEIKCGDEITVFYGQHYFGENNCECLCVTCEKNQKGGFALPVQEETEVKTNRRPMRVRKTPLVYEDYVPTPVKRSYSTIEKEPKRKLKVMSIDFICNKKRKRSKDIAVLVYPNDDGPSPKADSAVSLSSPDKNTLDDFLDDLSDLSSVSSTHDDIPKESYCVDCERPLGNVSTQVGNDPSLIHELATWTWSPSAVFTRWVPKRCPRCERHYAIFEHGWPLRKEKKVNKRSKVIKQEPPVSLPQDSLPKELEL